MKIFKGILLGMALAVLTFFVLKKTDNLPIDRQASRDRIETYQDSLSSLNDSLKTSSQSYDSLLTLASNLKKDLRVEKRKISRTEKSYRDSLAKLRESKLSELVDSSRIIVQDSITYVLVKEEQFREYLANEHEIEKLESLTGIYKNEIALQDSIMNVKDDQIFNLMDRMATYQHKVSLKDSIITEKDYSNELLEKQIKKYKLQRNIAGGVVIGTIVLILL